VRDDDEKGPRAGPGSKKTHNVLGIAAYRLPVAVSSYRAKILLQINLLCVVPDISYPPRDALMFKFVAQLNIDHYREILAAETDEKNGK
jgi:hypothetical protein